jgi:hypothetical protein
LIIRYHALARTHEHHVLTEIFELHKGPRRRVAVHDGVHEEDLVDVTQHDAGVLREIQTAVHELVEPALALRRSDHEIGAHAFPLVELAVVEAVPGVRSPIDTAIDENPEALVAASVRRAEPALREGVRRGGRVRVDRVEEERSLA